MAVVHSEEADVRVGCELHVPDARGNLQNPAVLAFAGRAGLPRAEGRGLAPPAPHLPGPASAAGRPAGQDVPRPGPRTPAPPQLSAPPGSVEPSSGLQGTAVPLAPACPCFRTASPCWLAQGSPGYVLRAVGDAGERTHQGLLLVPITHLSPWPGGWALSHLPTPLPQAPSTGLVKCTWVQRQRALTKASKGPGQPPVCRSRKGDMRGRCQNWVDSESEGPSVVSRPTAVGSASVSGPPT